jgi:dipeptidyl aminopeptidase/acylaminoacyl peptidase
MRLQTLTLIGFGFAGTLRAQTTPDTVDHLRQFFGYSRLIRGGQVTPHWLPDGRSFWYVSRAGDTVDLVRVDPAADRVGSIFDVPRLRAALRQALGREPGGAGVPFDSVRFVGDGRTVEFTAGGASFSLDLAEYGLTRLPAVDSVAWRRTHRRLVRKNYPFTGGDTYELESPDGKWFAREEKQNVVLRPASGGPERTLTRDGAGTIEWVLDNLDWGLGEGKGGARWSPDGRMLAALRRDVRGVIKMPVVSWLGQNEKVEWMWYPKTGQPIARQEVFILGVADGRRVRVDLGDVTDRYVSIIGWLPDGSRVVVARMTRDYKDLEFLAADPRTGRTTLLVAERPKTFVKGIEATPGLGGLFHLVGDGHQFVFVSERDGWDHLYLYDLDGKLVRRLTSGAWPVTAVLGIDAKNGWVYFLGHAEPRLYDTHLYRVKLDGTGFQRLTEGEGMHEIALGPSFEYFVDTRSKVDQPPVVDLVRTDGRRVRELSRGNIDALVAAGWQPPEEFWAKATDGTTDIRGVLYRPRGFDAAKRYPVVEYIYAGPQMVNAPRTFVANAIPLAIAQLGFVTLVVDARGTPERGKAFQDVVYRNFGRNEIPDHVAALKQAGSTRPWMDLSRVGIVGGSWGGYMTLRALLTAPEVYRAGLSIYPAADLTDHHQMIEAYMGRLETNREGYEYASNLRLADRLQGKLLLLHGTSDINAPFSATIQMVDALTRAGKRYELVVLPGQNHGFSAQNVGYWLETLRTFFVDKLRP